MGLRARLALFFVIITVLPLTVTVVALESQIDRQLRQRTGNELTSVGASATALIKVIRRRTGDLAHDLVQRGAGQELRGGDPAAAQAWLDQQSPDQLLQRADLVLLVAADGRPLAGVEASPQFAPGVQKPDRNALASGAVTERGLPGVLLTVSWFPALSPQPLGAVVTGVWTDRELLDQLSAVDGAAFVAHGQVLASLGDDPGAVPADEVPPPDEVAETSIGGEPVLLTAATWRTPEGAEDDSALLLWAPLQTRASGLALTVALLAATVLVVGAIGWFLAGTVVAPVRRAADVARAVAGGDLSRSLQPAGGRELADLATALNTMSAELASRLAELRRSRDELRRSLSRLGQTLSSSLDLNRTLSVVVETAMDALGAERAALLLYTPERDALYIKVGRGIGERQPRLRADEGIAGHVATAAAPLRLPADADGAPEAAPGEPVAVHQLAVPMLGRGQVIGVLSLLRDDAGRPFSKDDLDTLGTFAAQASVAIENVMLHQEAQRLSVTDPLTGLWNFRYFQLQADRELESATRFERPLSLAIIDIDHFKPINDRYGHQVGDEVLVELARRIRDSTRVPDVVARYGGEEFVVLLPGTDLDGALSTAERIRLAVVGSPVPVSHSATTSLAVSCSAGVAEFPRHARTVAGLVRNADAAMYSAKRQGRNRVVGARTGPGETRAAE